jgi:hypothetical protein
MYVQNLNQCKSPSFCDTCCILWIIISRGVSRTFYFCF